MTFQSWVFDHYRAARALKQAVVTALALAGAVLIGVACSGVVVARLALIGWAVMCAGAWWLRVR